MNENKITYASAYPKFQKCNLPLRSIFSLAVTVTVLVHDGCAHSSLLRSSFRNCISLRPLAPISSVLSGREQPSLPIYQKAPRDHGISGSRTSKLYLRPSKCEGKGKKGANATALRHRWSVFLLPALGCCSKRFELARVVCDNFIQSDRAVDRLCLFMYDAI